jgi:hypothetical protein
MKTAVNLIERIRRHRVHVTVANDGGDRVRAQAVCSCQKWRAPDRHELVTATDDAFRHHCDTGHRLASPRSWPNQDAYERVARPYAQATGHKLHPEDLHAGSNIGLEHGRTGELACVEALPIPTRTPGRWGRAVAVFVELAAGPVLLAFLLTIAATAALSSVFGSTRHPPAVLAVADVVIAVCGLLVASLTARIADIVGRRDGHDNESDLCEPCRYRNARLGGRD